MAGRQLQHRVRDRVRGSWRGVEPFRAQCSKAADADRLERGREDSPRIAGLCPNLQRPVVPYRHLAPADPRAIPASSASPRPRSPSSREARCPRARSAAAGGGGSTGSRPDSKICSTKIRESSAPPSSFDSNHSRSMISSRRGQGDSRISSDRATWASGMSIGGLVRINSATRTLIGRTRGCRLAGSVARIQSDQCPAGPLPKSRRPGPEALQDTRSASRAGTRSNFDASPTQGSPVRSETIPLRQCSPRRRRTHSPDISQITSRLCGNHTPVAWSREQNVLRTHPMT